MQNVLMRRVAVMGALLWLLCAPLAFGTLTPDSTGRADVSGEWRLRVVDRGGLGDAGLTLRQHGDSILGDYVSHGGNVAGLRGAISRTEVRAEIDTRIGIREERLQIVGVLVTSDSIAGTIALGSNPPARFVSWRVR